MDEGGGAIYGKEVLSLLLEYCFDTLNLHNVMLKVFSFNERAIYRTEFLGASNPVNNLSTTKYPKPSILTYQTDAFRMKKG